MEREQLVEQQRARGYYQQECDFAYLYQRSFKHCALVWTAEELAGGRPKPVLNELECSQ